MSNTNTSNFSNTNTNQEDVMQDEDGTVEDGEGTESEGIEQELEASAESESVEAAPAEGAEPVVEEVKAPAFEAFLAGLKAHATALGLTMKDQKGFFQFHNPASGHKMYVAKQTKGVTRIDTTIPESELPEISKPLDKPNGRIACHVVATPDAAQMALDVLSQFGGKIRPPERKPAAASVQADKK